MTRPCRSRSAIRDPQGAMVQTVSAERNATSGGYSAQPLAEGRYSAVAKQSDDVGNHTTSRGVSFEVDSHGPVPSLSTAPGARTGDATPTFAGTGGNAVGDALALTLRVYAGGAAAGPPVATAATNRDGAGHFVVGAGHLADGTYTASVTQGDDPGKHRHLDAGDVQR